MALFGLLASNATPTDPSECLQTIAKGNERERWQAAYALVKLLADRDASASDPIADAKRSVVETTDSILNRLGNLWPF